MSLEKKPFVPYKLEEDKEKDSGKIITMRLNKAFLGLIAADKKILNQSKESTIIKQLALIGHYVLHDDLTGKIIKVVLENKRKNKEVGLIDFD